MWRLNLALAVATLAAGCTGLQTVPADPNGQLDSCDHGPGVPSWIKYGSSQLEVKPAHNVNKKKYWRIKLQPDIGYEDSLVVVSGKTPDALNWINASGTQSVNDEIIICVPDNIEVGDYYYSVTVVGVGYIDPRVTVKE